MVGRLVSPQANFKVSGFTSPFGLARIYFYYNIRSLIDWSF